MGATESKPRFKNRSEAGKNLALLLDKYRNDAVVVYGLPRGGVVVAFEVAKRLDAPLSIIIARKIGHPQNPEYAIGAVSESGDLVGNTLEMKSAGQQWFEGQVVRQKKEAARRRKLYLKNKKKISAKGKVAIIVDDGIATGLTMEVAIAELRRENPKKIVVAVPVAASETAKKIQKIVNKFIALFKEKELFAIGSFYDSFPQVEDKEVISILDKAAKAKK